jgi:uncharacterized protein YukE
MEEVNNQPSWEDPSGKLAPKKKISYKETYKKYKILVWATSAIIILVIVVAAWPHSKNTIAPTPTPTVPVDTLEKVRVDVDAIRAVVQSQTDKVNTINDISIQLNQLRSQVSQLQQNPQTGASAEVTSKITSMESQISTLSTQVNEMKTAIGNSTSIGAVPTTVNGLTVTLLSKTTTIPMVDAGVLYTSQLAVKIANNTGKAITNLDVLGDISFQYTYGISPGYPKTEDSEGAVTYVSNYDGAGKISFEAYENTSGKVLSIANGSSITLRPKVSLMFPYATGSETINLSISAISYDAA